MEDLFFQNKQEPTERSLWFDKQDKTPKTPDKSDTAYYERLNQVERRLYAVCAAEEHVTNDADLPKETHQNFYADFKFDETFNGRKDKAFIWLSRFLT